MNGSRAGTADRARAAGIVNAKPPDERVDSIGPQARYRCRAPGTGWTRAGALAAASIIAAINTRLRRRCARPAEVPKFRYRPLSEVRLREALLIREFRVVYM